MRVSTFSSNCHFGVAQCFIYLNVKHCDFLCLKNMVCIGELHDVVIVREDTSVTLSCFDSPPTSSVMVVWKMMSAREDHWSYLLSANCIDGKTKGRSILFGGRTFEISADASLIFRAAPAAQGRYSCVVQEDHKNLQERTVLLVLIKCRPHNHTTTHSSFFNVYWYLQVLSPSFAVTVTPTPPVTVDSTVRLAAQVSPSSVAAWGTWVSPSGDHLHTEISHGMGGLLSKLPRITSKDNGVYTCRIRIYGNSGTSVSEHRVNVTVNGEIWRYFLKTRQSHKLLSQCYLLNLIWKA